MGEWFCEIAGRQIGPLSSHQLQAMADSGQILPTDSVRQGAAGDWFAAEHVRGLFPLGPTPPPVAIQTDENSADEVVPPEVFAAPANDASEHVAKNLAVLLHMRRRRQQQTLAIGSLVLLILGLLMAAIVVKYGEVSRVTEPTSLSKSAGRMIPAKKLASDQPPPAPPEISPIATDEAVPVEPKPQAVNPDELRMIVGNVPVLVKSVVRAEDSSGIKRLIITVEVSNPNAEDALAFSAWSGRPDTGGAKLFDDRGKRYNCLSVNFDVTLDAPAPQKINPRESVVDVLTFEPPDADIESLLLELPGEAFGVGATASFRIPAAMIAVGELPSAFSPPQSEAAPQKKRRAPQPGTPEYDFGISADEEFAPD